MVFCHQYLVHIRDSTGGRLGSAGPRGGYALLQSRARHEAERRSSRVANQFDVVDFVTIELTVVLGDTGSLQRQYLQRFIVNRIPIP